MRCTGAVVAVLLVLSAGCYSPELRDCTVSCSSASECAPGQICNAGFCRNADVADCTPPADADAGNDARRDAPETPIDGANLCAQGCSMGTCDGDVCVIDCTLPGACLASDVVCPANLPCRVECGDLSCAKKINCELSTSCEVLCTGTESCGDEIKCGNGPCDVTCSGANSCERRTKCANACSCDVSCTGAGSCAEASDCPSGGTTCRIGNGCTSQLAGCDSC